MIKIFAVSLLASIFLLQPSYAGEEKLTTVPLFQTCSIYLETEDMNTPCSVEFRKKGSDKWLKGFELVKSTNQSYPDKWKPSDPPYIDKPMLRGSIVNLEENTDYELKLTQGKNISTSNFRTWSPNPPVKKTVNLKKSNPQNGIKIGEKGTKDAWIKYTADKDFVLKADDKTDAVITLENAEYIIIENLKIEGGKLYGILLKNSNNIRIINCDISGFGRIGKQDLSKDGKYYTEDGKQVNYDGGIYINQSGNTVIERCYIHDPRGKANSWRYSHPAGPEAVVVWSTGGTVIRYNDFIGSDAHRWNDVVEGVGNGLAKGGFFKDAEIYGNNFYFGNDDGIELEGGEMNIKVFLNKIEGTLCGTSTGPCILGPSYIYRNLLVNLGDEDGISCALFKNGFAGDEEGQLFFFNNTAYGNTPAYNAYGNKEKKGKSIKAFLRNNIFSTPMGFLDEGVFKKENDFDYNLYYGANLSIMKKEHDLFTSKNSEKHGLFSKNPDFSAPEKGDYSLKNGSPALNTGIKINNFIDENQVDMGAVAQGENFVIPYRPIPLYLDRYQINFSSEKGKEPQTANIDANIKNAKNYTEDFEIKQNEVFDWFSIEPARGTFKENSKVQFKVSLNREKMQKPGLYKGAFLIRLSNGFSRAVTVYAVEEDKDIKKTAACFTQYIEAEKPSSKQLYEVKSDDKASEGRYVHFTGGDAGTKNDKTLSYNLEIPEDGKYFIFARVKSEPPVGANNSLYISIDNGEQFVSKLRSNLTWCWSGCSDNFKLGYGNTCKPIQFSKGKHTLKIAARQPVYVDLILITDNHLLLY